MTFQLFAFRFTFEALDRIFFPPGAAGNAFRGAFGHIFRGIACVPGCQQAKLCNIRDQCAYARLFEPACLDGPSGLTDAPRPFVVRASLLDGQTFESGGIFSIDVHIFDMREPAVAYFVLAFQELARNGIGRTRARIRLIRVCPLEGARHVGTCIYESGQFLTKDHPDSINLSLEPQEYTQNNPVIVRFLTPTALKSKGAVLRDDAPFDVVVARALERTANLSEFYGAGPLALDFRGMSHRALRVRTVSRSLRWQSHQRMSSRTGEKHPVDGFVGEVCYEGEMGEFLPFLRAVYWTGIGRQTVWGNGVVDLVCDGSQVAM